MLAVLSLLGCSTTTVKYSPDNVTVPVLANLAPDAKGKTFEIRFGGASNYGYYGADCRTMRQTVTNHLSLAAQEMGLTPSAADRPADYVWAAIMRECGTPFEAEVSWKAFANTFAWMVTLGIIPRSTAKLFSLELTISQQDKVVFQHQSRVEGATILTWWPLKRETRWTPLLVAQQMVELDAQGAFDAVHSL